MNGKKAKRLRAQLDYADERKEESEIMNRVIVARKIILLTGREVVVPITAQMMYPEAGVRRAYQILKKGKSQC